MFTFCIVFDGGFALVATCRELQFLLEKETGVVVKGFLSREEAYRFACEKYIERELKKNPYGQPVLPKLEDLGSLAYFKKPEMIAHSVSYRSFAALHPQYMGALTSAEAVASFLDYFPMQSMIWETGSVLEAQNLLNYEWLRRILPMSAYIKEQIPYLRDIPVNTILLAPYADWVQKHCNVPEYFAGEDFFSHTTELEKVVDRVKVKGEA